MQTQTIGVVGMLTLTLVATAILTARQAPAQTASTDPVPGQLTIIGKDNKPGNLCPLEGTSVDAQISGMGARVTVTQTFVNPTKEAIEAVYTFPLPQDCAVDRMTMQIGSRMIEAEIKRREEARQIYEDAKNNGQAAALLDQERPNVFTQSVANIMPGAKVKIVISYAQLLKFEAGQFEFVFPMVVGPRYTVNAPDPGKISPPIVPKGTRSGANIDLSIALDAGAPIQDMKSVLHKISVQKDDNGRAKIKLTRADEIPNKDFILQYKISTDSIQDAFVTHMGEKGGFFTLMLMPPKVPVSSQITPREVVFVMDQSGSQMGFPIEKSKELTLKLIQTLRPGDTFNVMGFNTEVKMLWPVAKPLNNDTLAQAMAFVKGMQANGGTNLREGAIAALQGQNDPDRLRLVIFNTDGYVGDEALILDTIQKNRDRARMFTFGIGNGVNRYLIDQMAYEGKGDVEYVTLASDADSAVERFIKRTRTPVLTDVTATFSGVDVYDALPEAIPDVFSDKPVVITGRYRSPGKGKLVLSGKLGGQPWSREIDLDFPAQASAPALESLWARQRVGELIRKNYLAMAYPDANRVSNEEVIQTALEFGIMTEFTSLVAVEKKIVNLGGKQRTVAVPVEMTDGVSYEGIFGQDRRRIVANSPAVLGGAGGASFQANAKSRAVKGQIAYSAMERTKDGGLAEVNMSPAERRKYRYESRVEKSLRESTGKVEIEVWLSKADAKTIELLRKAGMKIDFTDEKLRVVMGTCNAKQLMDLVQIEWVERIKKISN